MAVRNSPLISRVVFSQQSMVYAKGCTFNGGRLTDRKGPNLQRSRRRFTSDKFTSQCAPQCDLLRGDGDKILRLRYHERFVAESILHERQAVAPGREIAERAVEIVERGAERVGD